MFNWYWVFLFILIHIHLIHAAHSIYLHRGVSHGFFTVKKPLEYAFRFILWTDKRLGSRWAETYVSRHRKHHATSDTAQDPHSPHHMTWKEMRSSWYMDPEEVKKYCPDIKTPNDWMQRTLHEKYHNYGPWFVCALAGILFGLGGLVVMIVWQYLLEKFSIFLYVGNVMSHKNGFQYTGNHGPDQSTNLFPIGILFGGEELHNNHHFYPGDANYRHKWFEFDVGYAYATIFEKLGLLKIKK